MFKKILRTAIVTLVTMGGLSFGADCTKSESLNTVTVESKTFYKIGSCGDLYKFADLVNNTDATINGMLTADIEVNVNLLGTNNANVKADGSFDLDAYKTAHDGAEPDPWTPIGNLSMPYTGTFTGKDEDGISHTISGLYFNNDERNSVGLFGYVDGGVVKNVGVVDSYFKGMQNVGGVVGCVSNATITSVYNTGSVSGSGSSVGGVVGNVYNATITSVYNTGSVSGSSYVGGVVGYVSKATITSVYNTGSVSKTTGSEGQYFGNIVGRNNGASLAYAYYNTETSSFKAVGAKDGTSSDVEGTAGKTTAELASLTIGSKVGDKADLPLLEGETESPWEKGGVSYEKSTGKLTLSYPYLKSLPKPQNVEMEFKVKDNVFQISSTDDLKNFAKLVNEYHITDVDAELTTNLTVNSNLLGTDNANVKADGSFDLEAYKTAHDGAEPDPWTPIGNSSKKYTGTFNGAGKTVSGLYFNNDESNVGLFGYVDGGVVKNVGVVDSYFKGKQYVGGVVGYAKTNTTLTDVYNTGFVSGGDYVGGVVGDNFGGTISNAYNTGAVSGANNNVGGVVGYNFGGTISNAYNTGAVSGANSYVGGVVGSNTNNGTVSNSSNTGAVSGNGSVGGVIGGNGGTVSNSYNSGSVSASGNYVGGVTGNNTGGIISNSYNRGSVSGTRSVGGVTGNNTSETSVENAYNTGSVSGSSYVGGVVGSALNATITSVYNTGSISKTTGSEEQYFGSIVGWNNGVSLANAYYNTETSSFKAVGAEDGTSSDVEGTAGKTTAELAGATLETLGFDDQVWEKGDVSYKKSTGKLTLSYPYLKSLPKPQNVEMEFKVKDNVFQISSTDDLKNFAKLVNEYHITDVDAELTTNLTVNSNLLGTDNANVKADGSFDLEAYKTAHDGAEPDPWTPIGNSSKKYTGTFNGAGKTVSGLYFNNDESNVGLFGYVNGGVVKNVGVVDSYFKGKQYVGGVVGYADDATLTDVYNTGSVSGDYVGGVVGFASKATITSVYNTGSVSGSGYVGGVVGYAFNNTTLTDVYNTGSVSGDYVGGVVAYVNNATITSAYNTGSVSKTTGSGGKYFGSVVGRNDGGSLTNTYYNTETSSFKAVGAKDGTSSDVEGTAGKTTAELAGATLGTLGFGGDVWTAGNATPEVKEGKLVCKLPGLTKLGGSVEFAVFTPNKDGVYEISSAQQLKWFAQLVNNGKPEAKGILVDDIEFNDGSVYDGEGKLKSNLESWTPIGTFVAYTGTFDGNGKTVSGLYFNDGTKVYVGLFGVTGTGTVQNVGVIDSYLRGKDFVGGVVGYNGGTISNVYNTGSVSGTGGYVGGVVGYNYYGSIINVYNTGSVSGTGDGVGGVVGSNNGGTISNAYNTGSVSGTGDYVGGAIGGNTGTVSGVYYDMDMPCTNCSDVAGVGGKYSAELANSGFVGSSFKNASSVWSAGSFVNNNGMLTFKMPYLTSFGAGTQPTFSGSFAISARKKPVYKSKRFTADDFYTANFTIGSESFDKDAKGFKFSIFNDLTKSGTVGGTYHGVEFSLLMDPLVVVDGDKATIHGESKLTLKIAEGDGFTIKGPITIKRNFTANGYSTVMFPFSMKASSVSGATFYELANVVMKDGKWVVAVSEVKDTETEVGMVKANTPYLVKTANASELVLDEGEYTFVPTEGAQHSVESNGWNLVGTYGYKMWKEGDAGLGLTYGFAGAKGNPTAQIGKFGKIGAGAYIYPMRVYLEKNAASGVRSANGAKASDAIATLPESVDVVVVDGEAGEKTTVIGTLNSRTGEFKAAGKRYFDAKGRSVGKKPAAKGSYYNKRKAVAK